MGQEQVREGEEGKPALTIKNKDKDDKDDEMMIDDFKENTKTTEKPENINTGAGTAISKVLYDLLQSYNPKLVQSALANIMTTLEEEEAKDNTESINYDNSNNNSKRKKSSRNKRLQVAGLNLGLALMANSVQERKKETELQTLQLLNDFVDLRLNLMESKVHRIVEIEKLIDTERETLNVEREDLFQAIYKSMAYVPRSKGGGKKMNEKNLM